MKRIIFKNQDGTIGVIIPSQECIDLFGLDIIAKKDVPQQLPYWIVDTEIIPIDRTFRLAWEIDESMGEAHGIGSVYYTFEEVLKNDSN